MDIVTYIYKHLPSIKKIKKSFKSYDKECLLYKKGLEVKIGNEDILIYELPNYLKYFIQEVGLFYIIPVDVFGGILGYIFKAVDKKEYRVYQINDNRLLFGLYNFNDFSRNNVIFLTEGFRDCLYLQRYYKYTIGLLSSSLNKFTFRMLVGMSNRFILCFDNDAGGNQLDKLLIKYIEEFDCKYKIYKSIYKDFGDYFKYDVKLDKGFIDKLVEFD